MVGAVTPDGTVWGVTLGRGLASFDGQSWTDGGSWAFYDAADGLPSDQIIDLAVAPDGALWAITAGGIGYFGGRGWKSVELDHSLGAIRAMAFAPDGSIWLGTSEGVAHVQP
jgi:ligand-binding sensor domain-containing protein